MRKIILPLLSLALLAPASAQTPEVLASMDMKTDIIMPTPQMNQFINRYAKSFSSAGCQGETIGIVLTSSTSLELNVGDLYNEISKAVQAKGDMDLRDMAIDKANNVLVMVMREEGQDVMMLMQPKGNRLLMTGCEI